MLFNSTQFIIFFGVFFCLYIVTPKKIRWLLLLVGSYFFYASWNPRFLALIFITTVVDYFVSLNLARSESKRRRNLLLAASLMTNLSILFIFKYYNFFIDSLVDLLALLNITAYLPALRVILPVGISFYTFQTMGYTIDVFNRKVEPEQHFGRFALYISFFPQLVAGPIERASNLLPQLRHNLEFDYEKARSGLRLVVWGYFLKMVVADNLAFYVDQIYSSPRDHPGFPLILATLFFSFQIYGDFAGYSYIAIGLARILGVELKDNFRQPYLSTSIQEFWQRWHISLSSWFRDYLFFPISRSLRKSIRNPHHLVNLIVPPLVTMLISGLWHGANWTFVIWGGVHAIYIIAAAVVSRLRKTKKTTSKWMLFVQWAVVNVLICLAWVFFRANSVSDAIYVFTHAHLIPDFHQVIDVALSQKMGFVAIGVLLLGEFTYRYFLKEDIDGLPRWVRWISYLLLCLVIFNFASVQQIPFIYFQF